MGGGMTRFLVTSDPQIGAHPDYGRNLGDRLADDAGVWTRTLELAVEHRVDAVMHGGDAFQHRRPTPSQLMAFQRPLLAFLAEHDIPVLAINGNHDVESPSLPSSLELFEPVIDVHVEPGIWEAPGGVNVVTLPWVPMSKLRARMNGGDTDDISAIAAQLLVQIAQELYDRCDSPAILFGHWHIDAAVAMSGKGVSEIFREPLLCMAELERIGFDAMFFGHNHLAQPVGANAWHIGSPAPVDFGEANVEHGVWLLNVDDKSTSTTFLPIESRPFVTLDYDWREAALERDPVLEDLETEKVADAVVRVRYAASEEGARRVDHQAITRALYDAGAHKVYAIQPDIERAARVRVAGVDEDISPLAALDAWCDAQNIAERKPLAELTTRYLQETS